MISDATVLTIASLVPNHRRAIMKPVDCSLHFYVPVSLFVRIVLGIYCLP